MIIENGTLRFSAAAERSEDAQGNILQPAEAWGTAVPCQWRAVSQDLQSAAGAEPVRTTTYEILVLSSDWTASERIRLCDAAGTEIGKFSVSAAEPLAEVGIVRLTARR